MDRDESPRAVPNPRLSWPVRGLLVQHATVVAALRSRASLAVAALIASTMAFFALPARADEPATTPHVERVRWHDEWPRFRPLEYVYTVVALGGGLALRFALPSPDHNWRGGILVDDAIIDRMHLRNADNLSIARTMTDSAFYGAMAYRAVDSIAVPLIGYGDGDLALQMSMIDIEAFSTVGLVLWTTQLFVARERPQSIEICRERHQALDSPECLAGTSERNRSFFAGHPAISMTAAGLTCMHHSHNPLYGDAGDALACGVTIGAAVMNGVGRIWINEHYPSDVIVGWSIGALVGFGMPAVLHYGSRQRSSGRIARIDRSPSQLTVLPVPVIGDGRVGASLVGLF